MKPTFLLVGQENDGGLVGLVHDHMGAGKACVAKGVVVAVAAAHERGAPLKAQPAGRLAVLLAGELVDDFLLVKADALVDAAVQHGLAQHGQIFRVGVQARVTGHAAVCHPCIAVVALALQGVVAPAVKVRNASRSAVQS